MIRLIIAFLIISIILINIPLFKKQKKSLFLERDLFLKRKLIEIKKHNLEATHALITRLINVLPHINSVSDTPLISVCNVKKGVFELVSLVSTVKSVWLKIILQ